MAEREPDADFVGAFKQALADYNAWTAGGKEPDVTFKPLHGPPSSVGVSLIASWATAYGDCPLPANIYDCLLGLMDDTQDNQRRKAQLRANRSWETAGKVFGELIAVRNKQFGNTK
jgi:hypothetical protein